jgi:pimeloyl-ACP methyl ester carboxylesterase
MPARLWSDGGRWLGKAARSGLAAQPARNAFAAAAQLSERKPIRSEGVIVDHVISSDGTRIAYDQLGSGPAVLLIGSGPTDRRSEAPLAALLAEHFTVYNYDRRGRGDSGDTQPYATGREFEDIAALIERAGGPVMCYGTSGGGIIALQAATRGLPIGKLAVWEPPYFVPGARPPLPADYRDRQWALREQGHGGDMLELFFTEAIGMPADMVAGMKAAPFWEAMAAGATCLAYDADMLGDFSMPKEQLKSVTVPTLVVDGATTPWISTACHVLAGVLPDATRATLDGQPHNVDPAAIAPVITNFLQAAR